MALVDTAHGQDISGSNLTSIATTSGTMNVASGALIVVGVKHNSGVSVSAVSDGGSNSLVYVGTATNASAGQSLDIWRKENATANAAATWTATIGSAAYPAIRAVQFSGAALASALDASNFAGFSDASSTVTSGSFTPAQTNEVAIAFAMCNSLPGTWSPDTGWTQVASGAGLFIFAQYKTPVAASAQTVAATNDLGQYNAIGVATFKDAAGGGGGAGIGGFKSLLGVGR